jgi:hypothetical protein
VGVRVAIVGMSQSKNDAPADWPKWGVADDPDALRYDRVFEMHDEWREFPHADQLEHFASLVMQGADLPNATRYPIEEVTDSVTDYLESTVAYMFALAIHDGYDEIGLWGVDMKADDEYGYQKPNMEYLIGFARGKGIKVSIHPSSPLCKFSGMFGYAGRYGKR